MKIEQWSRANKTLICEGSSIGLWNTNQTVFLKKPKESYREEYSSLDEQCKKQGRSEARMRNTQTPYYLLGDELSKE